MFFLRVLIKLFSGILTFSILVCVVGSNISPIWFAYSSVASIVFPYLYMLLAIWAIVSCYFGWRVILVCAIGLFFGYSQIMVMYVPFWKKQEATQREEKKEPAMRVLSWNVGNFSTQLNKLDQKELEREFQRIIRIAKADILCLQEVAVLRRQNLIKKISQKLNYPYVKYGNFSSFNQTSYTGSVILSRFPFVSSGKTSDHTSLKNDLVNTVIKTPHFLLRAISVHFQSNKLTRELLENLRQLPKTQDQEVVFSASSKIASNSRIRVQQIQEVNALCDLSAIPTIICADLNDVAGSYNYDAMRRDRKDAFLEFGDGYRSTYVDDNYTLGIDFIFASPAILFLGYEQMECSLSDHLPHIAEVIIPIKP